MLKAVLFLYPFKNTRAPITLTGFRIEFMYMFWQEWYIAMVKYVDINIYYCKTVVVTQNLYFLSILSQSFTNVFKLSPLTPICDLKEAASGRDKLCSSSYLSRYISLSFMVVFILCWGEKSFISSVHSFACVGTHIIQSHIHTHTHKTK